MPDEVFQQDESEIKTISSSKEGIFNLTFRTYEEGVAWFNQRGFWVTFLLERHKQKYIEASRIFDDGRIQMHVVSIISDLPKVTNPDGTVTVRRGRPPKLKGEQAAEPDTTSSLGVPQEKGVMERTLDASEDLAEPETLEEEKIETVEASEASIKTPEESTGDKQEKRETGNENIDNANTHTITREETKRETTREKIEKKETTQLDWMEELLK